MFVEIDNDDDPFDSTLNATYERLPRSHRYARRDPYDLHFSALLRQALIMLGMKRHWIGFGSFLIQHQHAPDCNVVPIDYRQ